MEAGKNDPFSSAGAGKVSDHRRPAHHGPPDPQGFHQGGAGTALLPQHDLRQRSQPEGKGPALPLPEVKGTTALALPAARAAGRHHASGFSPLFPGRPTCAAVRATPAPDPGPGPAGAGGSDGGHGAGRGGHVPGRGAEPAGNGGLAILSGQLDEMPAIPPRHGPLYG